MDLEIAWCLGNSSVMNDAELILWQSFPDLAQQLTVLVKPHQVLTRGEDLKMSPMCLLHFSASVLCTDS